MVTDLVELIVMDFQYSFHHFPHFHVQSGEPGDVLIWDPEDNKLLISDKHDLHSVLCHQQKTLLEGQFFNYQFLTINVIY